MPREVMSPIFRFERVSVDNVDLFTSRFEPFESAAAFFAWLAYTGGEQANDRERFWKSLCRYYVSRLALLDPNFRMNGLVPASYALLDNKNPDTILWKGIKQIYARYYTGRFVVLPNLKEIITGQRQRVNGFAPTVDRMLDQVRANLKDIGWKAESNSGSTAKTKIWKPTWPVAHAAAGFAYCCRFNEFIRAHKTMDFHDVVFLFMTDEIAFINLLRKAELFRYLVPKIKRFNISTDAMIQFQYNRIDWSSIEGDKYFVPNLIKLDALLATFKGEIPARELTRVICGLLPDFPPVIR